MKNQTTQSQTALASDMTGSPHGQPPIAQPSTSVLIIESHAMVRQGMKACLEEGGKCKVVALAGDGYAGLLAIRNHSPQVVVVNSKLSGMDTLETVRRIKSVDGAPKIIVCYMNADHHSVHDFVAAGVQGFIGENSEPSEFCTAIDAVNAGGNYFTQTISTILFSTRKKPIQTANVFDLTQRELEILNLIADGMSNKEIARHFELSVRTVETHRLNIRRKTDASNLRDLIQIARDLGLPDSSGSTA